MLPASRFKVKTSNLNRIHALAVTQACDFDWSDNPTVDSDYSIVDVVEIKSAIIIGYKSPTVLFRDGIYPIDEGDVYVKVDEVGYAETYELSLQKGKGYCSSYLPKEIVETWNPVYSN